MAHLFAVPNRLPLTIGKEAAESFASPRWGDDEIGVEEALGGFEILPERPTQDRPFAIGTWGGTETDHHHAADARMGPIELLSPTHAQ